MVNILTPQATQLLTESIIETLTDYQVSEVVADKICALIVTKFNGKIVNFFAENVHLNEMAIIKEALAQCKGQSN